MAKLLAAQDRQRARAQVKLEKKLMRQRLEDEKEEQARIAKKHAGYLTNLGGTNMMEGIASGF